MMNVMQIKLIVAAIITKGLTIAIIVLAILGSHLSEFEKAIVIAAVSAFITGIFTLIASVTAVKLTRPIHQDIIDVKRKVDASRREGDSNDTE